MQLSAENVWTEISDRVRETVSDQTYDTWFGDIRARELEQDELTLEVPNDFTRSWIDGHFADLIGSAARDLLGPSGARARPRQRAGRPTRRPAAGPARRRAERQIHVRHVRHRLVQPFCSRGRARRRGGARARLQPTLRLRRNGPRQDAPAPGDRRLRVLGTLLPPLGALRHQRDADERLHQLDPGEASRGLQAALPRVRRAARRRHPVPRAQGEDPGGVLPHLQHALRSGAPDHPLVRPASAGHRNARGPAALALRVGAHRRHPAA